MTSDWADILKKHRNINFDIGDIIKDDDHVYKIDATNNDTDNIESYKIYDFSNKSNFHKNWLKETEDGYLPIISFKDMRSKNKIFHALTQNEKVAPTRRKINDFFTNTIIIYHDVPKEISLNVDSDGINYLEYTTGSNCDNSLKGYIYNISFLELQNLFNITGSHLFKNNVRYGLANHTLAKSLRLKFGEYMKSVILDILKSYDLSETQYNKITDYLEITNNDTLIKAEHFWFCHNGISILSYKDFKINGSKITLDPFDVSVINGAQTITNFFIVADDIEHNILPKINNILELENKPVIILDMILEKVIVKTVLIKGTHEHKTNITYGLNTQVPIFSETILASSNTVKEINKCLKNNAQILKDGEIATNLGYSPSNFVKVWLTINGKPGSSRNLDKKGLEKELKQILTSLKNNKDLPIVEKIENLHEINKWWESTKTERDSIASDNDVAKTIARFGKNYFGSFVIKNMDTNMAIDYDLLTLAYSIFEVKIRELNEKDLSTNTFKKNDLFERIPEVSFQMNSKLALLTEAQNEELVNLLNHETQSSYTYIKTIRKYIKSINNNLDVDTQYFRTISIEKGKAKEAFPFPNPTFSELINSNSTYKDYTNSLLKKEVNKEFPVFLIYKNSDAVDKIIYIPKFSFSTYDEYAKEVYNQTVKAFKEGDEYLFTKSSDDLKFHIRPRATDANDTFEFTNGKLITKRTFWANKSTVDEMISVYSKPIDANNNPTLT